MGRIETDRLDLDPVGPGDADEMAGVLADPALYAFTGGEPPSAADLRRRYDLQATGRSPDAAERWLNWIVRRRAEGDAIGYVQATVGVQPGAAVDVAWVIGTRWQGRGFAGEAAAAMADWLATAGFGAITAHIHPDHAASAAVARRIRLEPTGDVEDGERVWRRTG